MSIAAELRLAVRQRANFACEFCGVTETDTGGELTVDHFHPQTRGGTDDLDNLLYCCPRCNQYKADYWPTQPDDPILWNPRRDPIEAHLLLLADGRLYPVTVVGAFTLKRLRLNRPPLVAYRLQKQHQAEELRLLARYRDIVMVLGQLHQQQVALLEEQRALLEEQRTLLKLLLKQQG
jgi:hypothetical protein